MIIMPEAGHKRNNIYPHRLDFSRLHTRISSGYLLFTTKMVFILRNDQKMICSANYKS